MNSSLTTQYEAMVQQALVETGMASREAGLAAAQAKITDGKVDWLKWIVLMQLVLLFSMQLYSTYTINARLDRIIADLSAQIAKMDGRMAEARQLAVERQERNDLYRRQER